MARFDLRAEREVVGKSFNTFETKVLFSSLLIGSL